MSAVVPFSTVEEIVAFVRGGNATFTLESQKTGTHFTYKVSQPKDDAGKRGGPFFVKLLTGPDNEANYTYVGILDDASVRLTKASKMTCDAPAVKALDYVARHVAAGQMPPYCLVRHEGRCGVCNRKLTHPESLTRGIGPECWSKM